MNNPDKIIMTIAEFLKGAQTSELGAQELDEEVEEKIKDAKTRRDEEWSVLANQVVGGESVVFPSEKPACTGEGPLETEA